MDKLKHFQKDNNKETPTDYLKAAMIIIMWVLVWQIEAGFLMGASGMGETTLLGIIMGHEKACGSCIGFDE